MKDTQKIKEEAMLEAARYGLGILKQSNTVIGINKNEKAFIIYDPEHDSISENVEDVPLWQRVKDNLRFNRLIGIPTYDDITDYLSKITQDDPVVIDTIIKAIKKDLVLYRRGNQVYGYDINDLEKILLLEYDETEKIWEKLGIFLDTYEAKRYTQIDTQNNLEDQLKRLQADYSNLKKRAEDEKSEMILFANQKLLKEFIEVYTEFELATKYINDEGFTKLVEKFSRFLLKQGVEIIDPINQNFDPQLHEAIEKVPGEENKVIKVYSKLYLLNGKLLKPAFIAVGDGS